MSTPSAAPRAAVWIPRTQMDWAVLYCRVMTLIGLQGLATILLYWIKGPGTTLAGMPLGLQIDFAHGWIHLIPGFIGAALGWTRHPFALRYVQAFGLFYLTLAVLGTFTDIHFGMQLELNENALHWFLGGWAAIIGFGMLRLPRRKG